MSGDVERVAMQLMAELGLKLQWPSASEGWRNRYRAAALVAMRETRLIDAEAAKLEAAEHKECEQWQLAANWRERADWLTTRAGDQP